MSLEVMKCENEVENMQNKIPESERHVANIKEDEVEEEEADCAYDNIEFYWQRQISSGQKVRRNVLVRKFL